MKTALIIFTTIVITLSSCEGVVHMQGVVYDNETKKPIENAQVLLVLRKDTVRNIYYEYDTISYNQRMAQRKAGIKDEYKNYNVGGLSKKPAPSLTDTSGRFTVGSILVPCVPKCPNCTLVFIKEGYKPLLVKPGSTVNDSMQVSLERL